MNLLIVQEFLKYIHLFNTVEFFDDRKHTNHRRQKAL